MMNHRFSFIAWPLLILVCFSAALHGQQRPSRANTVIVKVKPEYSDRCTDNAIDIDALATLWEVLAVQDVSRKFPNASKSRTGRAAAGASTSRTDISTIYEVRYDRPVSPEKAAQMLARTGVFAYAEPAWINQVLYVPGDALLADQWHLVNIRAFEAWDVDTGSKDIVIGVIDTGIDWDHEDLVDAIAYNEADPEDGVDNDNNGYTDDYRGWNFYDGNNNPDETSWSHGTHVSGLACAVTDNGIGVAGTGFACRVLPIKAGDKLELTHGYEAIVYAVERGAKVINCSWGSTGYTAFGHDIVRFATENDALVVCGAGNNNDDQDFYPATFPEAMSVAATDPDDKKADFSSYNYAVDVSAPGAVIFSTKNGTYATESGTSMSSPIVAGAAGLVRHRFPDLTALQVKAQLCESARHIDTVAGNEDYQYRLGHGLLDMRAALEMISTPSIQMEDYAVRDGIDNAYFLGDEFQLSIFLANYLNQAGDVQVIARSLSPNVVVLDSLRSFGDLGSMQRSDNFSNPWQLKVVGKSAYNEVADIELRITSGAYVRNEYVRVVINPDFVNVMVNDVHVTVGNLGHVGYANNSGSIGLGFDLSGYGNLLYESGVMIGHDGSDHSRVLDRVRGEIGKDRDFSQLRTISLLPPRTGFAFEAYGVFSDTSARRDKLGVEVSQRVQAFDHPGHRNYVWITYTVHNTSGSDLLGVYVGAFADWDVLNASSNFGRTSFSRRLGYIQMTGDTAVSAGIQILSDKRGIHSYMINNTAEDVMNIGDGFSTDEKYQAMTSDRWEIGDAEAPADVSQVMSTGGFDIAAGDSVSVTFAYLAAPSPEALLQVADSSFRKFHGYVPADTVTSLFRINALFPIPAWEKVDCHFTLKERSDITVQWMDMHGQILMQSSPTWYQDGHQRVELKVPFTASGTYIMRFVGQNFVHTERVVILDP